MSIRKERTREGAVLRITLDRPKANILDTEMIGAISAAIQEAEAEAPRLKAIVFDASGPNFSFGASVEEHQKEQAEGMLQRFHGLFRELAELAIPTCALVRGRCLGGGLELASWCTWLVLGPDAKLGQPEVRLSVFPPMASLLLPARIGTGAAIDLCVSGRTIDAEEALRIGLATVVTDDPSAWWDGFYAENLQESSAVGLRFAERAARASLVDLLERHLPALERLYVDELMETHDANEGIRAFMAREKPSYEDR